MSDFINNEISIIVSSNPKILSRFLTEKLKSLLILG
jgi:hypothetical protein